MDKSYRAFLLRIWRTNTEAGPAWRVVLEHCGTRERWGFTGLGKLCAFLEHETVCDSASLPDTDVSASSIDLGVFKVSNKHPLT